MAVTKADIKKLMSKGLTGKEAARLILQDSWEVDHNRPGFLSQADIQRLKNGLGSPENIRDYNKYVHAYQLVDYTLKDGRIAVLEAIQALLLACKELETFWLEDRVKQLQMYALPAIVTQKQYDELRARQREIKLQWLSNIQEVIGDIALERQPELEDQAAKADEEGYFYDFHDWLETNRPEAYRQAVQILIEHIREDRLKPVMLSPEQRQAMLDIQKQIGAIDEDKKSDPLKPYPSEWHQLWQQKQERLQSFYQAGRGQQDQSELLRLLERLLEVCQIEDGQLTEEESDALTSTYCSGADLIQIGLSRAWIEEYEPNLEEETLARPAGMMQSSRVAILQNPKPGDLDERGYYKEPGFLEKLSGYASRNDKDRSETRGFSIPELLEGVHKQASKHIKIFLAIQASIEAVSETVGVKFTEDLDEWYEELGLYASMYNSLLEPRGEYHQPPHYLGMPKLEALRIGRLKPTARSLRYYRERMALALGDDWIKEAFRTLDFKPSETGSLAERMAKEMRLAKQELGLTEPEEESDGQAN